MRALLFAGRHVNTRRPLEVIRAAEHDDRKPRRTGTRLLVPVIRRQEGRCIVRRGCLLLTCTIPVWRSRVRRSRALVSRWSALGTWQSSLLKASAYCVSSTPYHKHHPVSYPAWYMLMSLRSVGNVKSARWQRYTYVRALKVESIHSYVVYKVLGVALEKVQAPLLTIPRR